MSLETVNRKKMTVVNISLNGTSALIDETDRRFQCLKSYGASC
jgi:hypothetical protein